MSQSPYIDPRVHCVGVSSLRAMTAGKLASMKDDIYLLQQGDKPLAVIVSLQDLFGNAN